MEVLIGIGMPIVFMGLFFVGLWLVVRIVRNAWKK